MSAPADGAWREATTDDGGGLPHRKPTPAHIVAAQTAAQQRRLAAAVAHRERVAAEAPVVADVVAEVVPPRVRPPTPRTPVVVAEASAEEETDAAEEDEAPTATRWAMTLGERVARGLAECPWPWEVGPRRRKPAADIVHYEPIRLVDGGEAMHDAARRLCVSIYAMQARARRCNALPRSAAGRVPAEYRIGLAPAAWDAMARGLARISDHPLPPTREQRRVGRVAKVQAHLDAHPTATTREIAEAIGAPHYAVARDIADLRAWKMMQARRTLRGDR